MRASEIVTLPVRTGFLLLLFGAAYYLGYGTLREEWRKDSPGSGIVARYSRNGLPWRTFCDRNRDGKWDMWIDERAGHPYIVSIDEDGDGKPDRDEDERGRPLSAWRASKLRSYKTILEFLHNRRQMAFTGLAILLYAVLEFVVRMYSRFFPFSRD
jgi:hypothetical protein